MDLTLSNIEGKEYSLLVEGTDKLTVFGKGNAVYVDNLIIKTDMAVSTSTNGKFSLITDGFISVEKGKLSLAGGGGVWASGDITIYSDVEAMCNLSAALISSSDIRIVGGKVDLNGGVDKDSDYRFGMGAGNNINIEGGTVHAFGTYGIYAQTGYIRIISDTTATGEEYGIYAMEGPVMIQSNTMTNVTATDGDGIWARYAIRLLSDVHATGTDSAIYSKGGQIDLFDTGMIVNKPSGGKQRSDGKTIVDAAGKTAKEVELLYKPVTGTATLTPSDVHVGDKLGVNVSGGPSSYEIDWLRSDDKSEWKGIGSGKNYTTVAGDAGKYIKAMITANGYGGAIYSDICQVKNIEALTGSVVYQSAVRYGTQISMGTTGKLSNIPTEKKHPQWEISTDGASWSEVKGGTVVRLTPTEDMIGKQLRLRITADGYTGAIYSTAHLVGKRLNNADPVPATLKCVSPYDTIQITNADPEQEYLLSQSYAQPSASAWSAAKSPASKGVLSLSCTKDLTYYVFTRRKETATDEVGTKTVLSSVYTGTSTSLKGIAFDKTRFTTKEGEATRLEVKPLPEDVPNWDSLTVSWYVNGTGVELYEDANCTKKLETSKAIYTKVAYVKATAMTRGVSVGAQRQVGYTDLLRTECIVTVTDTQGNHVLEELLIDPVAMRPGETATIEYDTYPSPAKVGTLSFEKNQGPSDLIITAQSGKKIKIEVPADAQEGNYYYNVKVDGSSTPILSTLNVTVSKTAKEYVSFDANGGSGYMAPVLVEQGTEYILPECKFKAPDGSEFECWDKGAVGESIIIGQATTLKAQWKDHDHTLEYIEVEEPDCVNKGYKEHYVCTKCGEFFEDADGEKPIKNKADIEIPALGHDMEIIQATKPTCETDGNIEHYRCKRCGGYYYDSEGHNKVSNYYDLILPAFGHSWGEWVIVKEPTQTEKGLKKRTCLEDPSHVEYAEIPALGDPGEDVGLKLYLQDDMLKLNSDGVWEAVYRGEALMPDVVVKNNGVKLTEGNDYKLKYSDNTNVGVAKVKVSGKGSYTKSDKLEFVIVKKNIADPDVAVGNLSYQKGKKADPALIYNGKALKEKKDYSLKQEGNKLTIEGTGNFCGTITADAVEVESDVYKSSSIKVKLSNKIDKTYNGVEQTLMYDELSVTDKDGKVLKENLDYIISYSSNVNAGRVKVTVTGIGKYNGKVNKSFRIKPYKSSTPVKVTKDKDTYIYSKNGVKPRLTVEAELPFFGWDLLTEGVDYRVIYSANKKTGTAKYKIRFIGNYSGTEYKGDCTYTITEAKPDTEEIAVIAGDMVFKKEGKYKPKVWVIANGSLLSKSETEIEYSQKDKLTGEASGLGITINSKGKNYVFSGITAKYNVLKTDRKDVSKAKVTLVQDSKQIKSMQYTGKRIEFKSTDTTKPQISINIGGEILTGADVEKNFYIFYADNIEKGKATIVLKAKPGSAYIGACAGSFKITAREIKK